MPLVSLLYCINCFDKLFRPDITVMVDSRVCRGYRVTSKPEEGDAARLLTVLYCFDKLFRPDITVMVDLRVCRGYRVTSKPEEGDAARLLTVLCCIVLTNCVSPLI